LDGSRTTSLCEEDHFLQQLSQIPRCAQKLDVISFTLGFDETIRSLEADIEILESATDSIKLSPKFPKILEVILMIVNQAFVKSDGQKVKAFDIHVSNQIFLFTPSKEISSEKNSLIILCDSCLESYKTGK